MSNKENMEQVRQARLSKNMTLDELATLTGYTITTCWNWENVYVPPTRLNWILDTLKKSKKVRRKRKLKGA